jgi:GNAT superfamily N-acetyltransferase
VWAAIEAQCWPEDLAADEAKCGARIDAWPEGQWGAERDGRLVGVVTSQCLSSAFLKSGAATYARLTDHGAYGASHNPSGDIFQLVAVSVSPDARGMKLGRLLVDHALDFARSLDGIARRIGFTRPIGYHLHSDMKIDGYLDLRDENGRWVDPVLDFHLRAGARVTSCHADYRPEDGDALGYGVLIEYPL